jgi:hypothetical protein
MSSLRKFAQSRYLLCAILLLACFAAAPLEAQHGRCTQCVWSPCNNGLGAQCLTGQQVTICTRSDLQEGCYLHCSDTLQISCSGSGGLAAACTGSEATAKAVRARQAQGNPTADLTDEQLQVELLKANAATVRAEWQLGSPVTFTEVNHEAHDMVESAKIMNLSKKNIVAIRVGWTIKTPNTPNEQKLGDWINFADGILPDGITVISAQKIDTAPLWKFGTVVRVYISQAKFADGTVWQREPEAKADSKDNSTASS